MDIPRTKPKNKFKKIKRIIFALLIIIGIIVVGFFSLVYLLYYLGERSKPVGYDIIINREFSTKEEEIAIIKVEKLEQTYLKNTKIDYYQSEINKFKKEKWRVDSGLDYLASAKHHESILIKYLREKKEVLVNGQVYQISDLSGVMDIYGGEIMIDGQLRPINVRDFHKRFNQKTGVTTTIYEPDVEFEVKKGFIVEQSLKYHEIRGPLSGLWEEHKQIVVLNDACEPVLILISEQTTLS